MLARRRAFLFLQQFEKDLFNEVGPQLYTANEPRLEHFKTDLAQLMATYSNPDQFTNVQQELEQVKEVMVANMGIDAS